MVARAQVRNVGVAALARELKLPQPTVTQMMQRGKTIEEIRAYAAIRHGSPLPGKSAPAPAETTPPAETVPPTKSEYDLLCEAREKANELESAKLRRAKALAEKQEIENQVRRGELLPAAYVMRWAARFLVDGRDELMRLPSELADALAGELDPLKVRATLEAAMLRALAKWENINRILESDLDIQKVA